MKLKTRLIFLLLIILSAACCKKTCYNTAISDDQCQSDQSYYARRAYLEQRAKEGSIPAMSTHNVSEGELILDLTEESLEAEWARLPYETVDNWIARIQEVLRTNRDTLQMLESDFGAVEQQEREMVNEMQALIRQNRELREMIGEETLTLAFEKQMGLHTGQENQRQEVQPFHLHLVKEGETLFSITQHYYGSKEAIRKVMQWNQGWIRNPHQVIAGMGLLLFPEEAPVKNEEIVESYLHQLDHGARVR